MPERERADIICSYKNLLTKVKDMKCAKSGQIDIRL